MTDQNPEQPTEPDDDDLSLSGKGWDILVGGKDNVGALGGRDPFDHDEDGVIELKALADIAAERKAAPPLETVPQGDLAAMAEASPAPPALIREEGLPDLTPEQLMAMDDEAPVPPPSESAPTSVDLDSLTAEPTVEPDLPPEPQTDTIADLFDELSKTGVPKEKFGIVPPPPDKASVMGAGTQPPVNEEPRTFSLPRAMDAGFIGPDDLFTGEGRIPLSSRKDIDQDKLKVDEEIADMLVTPERISRLWDQIDELYAVVVDGVRGNYKSTEQSLADLQLARELLLAGRDYYDEAEELVMMVKARLRLSYKVREWSRTRATVISIYLFIWLVGMSAFSVFIPRLESFVAGEGVSPFLVGTILPGLFGGLGAVVGAVWVLIKHTTRDRDFDPSHQAWFYWNPVLGIALGVLTYILIYGGGALFSIAPGGQMSSFDPSQSVAVWGICAIVGFRQNVFWKLIERIMSGIFPDDEEDGDEVLSRLNNDEESKDA